MPYEVLLGSFLHSQIWYIRHTYVKCKYVSQLKTFNMLKKVSPCNLTQYLLGQFLDKHARLIILPFFKFASDTVFVKLR